MDNEGVLRENLVAFLTGEYARMSFEEAVAEFPMNRINDRLPNADYTPWHLLEHLRRAQWDILDFIKNPEYREPEWPRDYWPARDAVASPSQWKETVDSFKRDLQELEAMVEDPARDLYAEIPWGEGQTFLREIVTVSNHNSFHIGEFAISRQAMGTWGKGHRG